MNVSLALEHRGLQYAVGSNPAMRLSTPAPDLQRRRQRGLTP
jgi:hypothetical protein